MIETSGYESINQSHAAAILFHKFNQSDTAGIDQGQKVKLKELAPQDIFEAVVEANPSKDKVGRIIGELKQLE